MELHYHPHMTENWQKIVNLSCYDSFMLWFIHVVYCDYPAKKWKKKDGQADWEKSKNERLKSEAGRRENRD